ncbi:MAG: DUF362 domain-containing protein [Deltaproteobacteria bacterium]|nr:MAG: DUF362 domain-containing protein [Deltaproteobacteria bacterium]
MASPVYFSDLKTTFQRNLFDKLEMLLEKVDLKSKILKNELVALKLHFGEKGNSSFIRPPFVRKIVELVKQYQGKPFLTDTSTLYLGSRRDAVSHIQTAIEHGFDYSVVGAPIIIADGIRGISAVEVEIEKPIYRSVSIGAEIVRSDVIIGISHFKGHGLVGFGGTLKNLGMGCANRQGKLNMHSNVAPRVTPRSCTSCGTCARWCSFGAISYKDPDKKAYIDSKKCGGCGQCLIICPEKSIKFSWDAKTQEVQKKIVEYACGVLKGKEKKSAFLNFIIQVTPDCDCFNHSGTPIIKDIGILASTDPVAIDQASVDLVNRVEGNHDSTLSGGHEPGGDKFRGLYPDSEWEIQLNYGEKLKLGTRKYEIVKVG